MTERDVLDQANGVVNSYLLDRIVTETVLLSAMVKNRAEIGDCMKQVAETNSWLRFIHGEDTLRYQTLRYSLIMDSKGGFDLIQGRVINCE